MGYGCCGTDGWRLEFLAVEKGAPGRNGEEVEAHCEEEGGCALGSARGVEREVVVRI